MTGDQSKLGVAVLASTLVLFQLVAHVDSTPSGALTLTEPHISGGDEPHYLLVMNSLLHDGDVALQDDYWRVALGSGEAGAAWNGYLLDHHSFIMEPETGRSWVWSAVYDPYKLDRCRPRACMGFFPREGVVPPSRDVTFEVPAHPLAFPALVAAVIAPFRPSPHEGEALAVRAVAVLSWLAIVALYLAGRRAGLPVRVSAAAVLLVAVASSFLPYARSFFVETTLALALAAGLWAMQAERPLVAGVCVACALFLKAPFVLVGVGWAAERLWARRPRAAFTIAAVVGVASIALMALNWTLARRALIGGAEALVFVASLEPTLRALFDLKSGVLPFVPWVAIPLVAIALRRPSLAPPATAEAALLRQIALPTALYLAVIATLGNSPGFCYGPRFWIPVLPLLGLAAVMLARAHRAVLAALVVLAVVSASIAVPAAARYRHLFFSTPADAWADPFGSAGPDAP